MFSFFFKRKKIESVFLQTDIHSHLLPAIDDGSQSLEQSLDLIRSFRDAGFKKLITTPHIISDTYRNTPEIINAKLNELRNFLGSDYNDIKLEAAAEYYLDPWLMNEVEKKSKLLTFGENYFLFEMNYLTEPYQLNDFLFKVSMQGYKPVLAHPERYQFMTVAKAEDLHHRGVLLQINLLSLIGFYSKPVQSMAEQLIAHQLVDFIGSDCHSMRHASLLTTAFKNKYIQKAMNLPLLNHLV
ncbi:MAG TPA: capsular biosynthesis protein [Cytophagales bacterium]|nr:capsular biosynthesis protein [Cytophagales bacterium]